MITFIVPVWNSIEFLPQAIDSILCQTVKQWRLLISDNGSDDGTREYLNKLSLQSDPRVKVFFQTENLGIFGNLNFLVEKVETDLIQILCADDTLSSPQSLASILDYWNSAENDVGAIRWGGQKLINIGIPPIVRSDFSQFYFFLFGNIMGNLSCVSCRISTLRSAGQFDQSYPYVGDFEFWSRMAQYTDIKISKLQATSVRRHPGQASNYLNKNGQMYIERARATSYLFNRLSISKGGNSRILFKIAGNLVYDVEWRFGALRAFLVHGNKKLFVSLNRASTLSSYVLPKFVVFLIMLLTLGGRFGKKFILFSALKSAKVPFVQNPQ